MKRIELLIEARLRATEEMLGECYLPRIIRFCRKFKFTENETNIALYCLIRQFSQKYERRRLLLCGCCDRRQSGSGSDCVTISRFLEIPIMEVLNFITNERLHMKQEIFPEIRRYNALHGQINYQLDFCKVLMGLKMTDSELMKLEGTILDDVVKEEPDNKYLA